MKKFSIITINLNNKEGLLRTIKSVVGQTCKDYEYIIIDGGSTDGSVEIIREYALQIDYWVSEPDKGIYNAMNKGILHACGEYLNFMNSGDYFYDLFVLENVAALAKADIVLGRDHREGFDKRSHGFDKKDISLIDLWKEPINHQSAFIHKRLFEKHIYDESYKIFADQKFFVNVLIKDNCTFQNLDMIVVNYDINGLSAKSLLLDEERERIYRELLPERVFVDYELFSRMDTRKMPVLRYMSDLKDAYRFQLFICRVIALYLKVKNKLYLKKK